MADISTLSLVELKELERIIPREIKRREAEERTKVRKELEAFAQSRGFSLSQLVGGDIEKIRGTRFGNKIEPRYRHPQQADLTWTGRGRKPKWVEAWLGNGGALDQLAV
jgi:DNA-binding protein H-NS